MSMQQINLYQSEFRKAAVMVSAQQVLTAAAGLLLLLVAIAGFNYVQLNGKEAELARLQVLKDEKFARLASLQQQVQARQKDKKLLHDIDRLSTEIANKQNVMKVLSDQKFGNTGGFTEHVKGLARQRIEGMWLTELSISQGGAYLGLKGHALQAELLPQYLQRLGSEEAFLGKEFETLNMARNSQNPKWMDFDLRTIALNSTGSPKSVVTEPSQGSQP